MSGREVTAMILFIVIVIMVMVCVTSTGDCTDAVSAIDPYAPSRWTLRCGCYIEAERGVWVPLEAYKWWMESIDE